MQPLDGRCPECGADVVRSLTMGSSSPLDCVLDRVSWALLAAGVALTLATGGFVVACKVAGVTSEDIHSGPTTRHAAEFGWFYEQFLMRPIPLLGLAGLPTCAAIATVCGVRNRFGATLRAGGAGALTIAYSILWASI